MSSASRADRIIAGPFLNAKDAATTPGAPLVLTATIELTRVAYAKPIKVRTPGGTFRDGTPYAGHITTAHTERRELTERVEVRIELNAGELVWALGSQAARNKSARSSLKDGMGKGRVLSRTIIADKIEPIALEPGYEVLP